MIIGTKGLDEQKALCAAELNELFVGGDNLAKGGVPAEIPAAVPSGQLLRIISTCKQYHDLVKQLAQIEDGLEEPKLIEQMDDLREKASALINTPPPVLAKKPRIIMPGA